MESDSYSTFIGIYIAGAVQWYSSFSVTTQGAKINFLQVLTYKIVLE